MSQLSTVVGVCPSPLCIPPYYGCDQCVAMASAWTMLPFTPFAGLGPHVLWPLAGCEFTSNCYLDCPECPEGAAAVWYVQVSDGDLPYGSEVMVPGQLPCEFTGCCPEPLKVFI